MIRNTLSSIQDIGIYPTIAFVAFFTLFLVVCFIVYKMDKKTVKYLSEIPLNDSSEPEKS